MSKPAEDPTELQMAMSMVRAAIVALSTGESAPDRKRARRLLQAALALLGE